MKTTIFTLITVLGTVLGISNQSKAETVKSATATAIVLTDVSNFSNIEVRGNVELYVTTGPVNEVKVYNNYYGENALVQNQNGILRVASYKAEKLVVWVTVNDLRNVSLYDNAEIRSFGKFSALNLNLNLYNKSAAQLNMDVYSASIRVNDHAKADLIGMADNCDLVYTQSASVNSVKFAVNHFNRGVLKGNTVTPIKSEQLAGL